MEKMQNEIMRIIDNEIKEILKYKDIAKAKPNWRTCKARYKSMVALKRLNNIKIKLEELFEKNAK